MTALGGKQQRRADAGGEESHGMFVFQSETDDSAEPQPKVWRAAVNDSDEQINGAHPKQRFERVHGKEIADAEKDERAKRSCAAERDCPTPSAKLARDHPGQGNVECARNRWKETDCEKGIAEQDAAQPNKQRGKRRQIDITKGEVLTAGDVIELVAKITVTAVGEKMDEQSHCTEEDDKFLFGCEPAWYWRPSRPHFGRIHRKRLRANRRCNSSPFVRRRDSAPRGLILCARWTLAIRSE